MTTPKLLYAVCLLKYLEKTCFLAYNFLAICLLHHSQLNSITLIYLDKFPAYVNKPSSLCCLKFGRLIL